MDESIQKARERRQTLRQLRRRQKAKEGLMAFGLIFALFTGFSLVERISSHNQMNAEAKDGRSGRLIDHQIMAQQAQQRLAGTLFFDTDGDTNTAEIVTHYHTLCAHEVEAIRQMHIGEVRKVSEWKRDLRGKCRLEHFVWNELEKGN